MRIGILVMALAVCMLFSSGCLSSSTGTCSLEQELEACPVPQECCKGGCLEGCLDPGTPGAYSYILRGREGGMQIQLYEGMNTYAACIGESIQDEYHLTCEKRGLFSSTWTEIFVDERNTTLRKLEDPYQKAYVADLLNQIKNRASNPDDQARIAISLVQQIPYDTVKQEAFLQGSYSTNRIPYQVLYEHRGICNEKTKLLTFLLKELGYGVALLSYQEEKHMAVGVLVPPPYRSPGCGEYAFIETTRPAIPTYVNPDLTTLPVIIPITEGSALESIEEEYIDARELERLLSIEGGLRPDEYQQVKSLSRKYGLDIIFR